MGALSVGSWDILKSMKHKLLDNNSRDEITDLFAAVFTASEGEQEGRLIGDLAAQLAANIDNQGIICCAAYEDDLLVGAIFFTRLRFSAPISVYMLAPVAVSSAHQGKGVGQALIKYGLDQLKQRGVEVVVTYGDPAFYSRVGFEPLAESVIQAPLELSMPQGWLGQALSSNAIPVISERPVCVKAFDNPIYW